MDVSICQNFATRGFQVFVLLQFLSLLVTRSLSQPWPNTTALGIHIDEYDRFGIAITNETADIVTFARGYFDMLNASSVSAILMESSNPPQGKGMIWTALQEEGHQSTTLLQAALEELQRLPMAGISHDSCVIALPKRLPDSQSSLSSSLLRAIFGCGEEAFCTSEQGPIVAATYIQAHEVEESPAAIVHPDGSTSIIGEMGVPVIEEVLPPPFDLEKTLSNYTISKLVIVREDGTMPFGQTYGPSSTPIQYEHPDIITRGAALMAAWSLPQQPIDLLWPAIGVVLRSSLSYILVPRFSLLPTQKNLIVTTVHDGQSVVAIDLRQGNRPRVEDTLPLARLLLEGISPAPAGTPQIHISIAVDKWDGKIRVEAVEPLSGASDRKVVDKAHVTYGAEVVNKYDSDEIWLKHHEEDEQLRARADEWMLRTSEQHEHAIQLFKEMHSRHEEL